MIRCPYCGREFEPLPAEALSPTHPAPAPQHEPRSVTDFIRRYKRPASCTEEMECRVLYLATIWSHQVARLTVVSQARFAAIHARLEDGFADAACKSAIEAYATDKWHVDNPQARKDLADFFAVKTLEKWIREAADKANPRDDRKHPNPLPLDDEARRRRDWDKLDAADRRRFSQAVKDKLKAAGIDNPDWRMVLGRAMDLMDKEREHGRDDPNQPDGTGNTGSGGNAGNATGPGPDGSAQAGGRNP